MTSKPETVKDALMMSARAAVKREIATSMAERGDYHASWERAEADEMDEAAGKFLDIGSQALHVTGPVKPGNGGEMLVVTRDMHVDVPGMVDTVRERPSMLAAEASESRLRLTGNAMVLAVDTAQSINAANSPEKDAGAPARYLAPPGYARRWQGQRPTGTTWPAQSGHLG